MSCNKFYANWYWDQDNATRLCVNVFQILWATYFRDKLVCCHKLQLLNKALGSRIYVWAIFIPILKTYQPPSHWSLKSNIGQWSWVSSYMKWDPHFFEWKWRSSFRTRYLPSISGAFIHKGAKFSFLFKRLLFLRLVPKGWSKYVRIADKANPSTHHLRSGVGGEVISSNSIRKA